MNYDGGECRLYREGFREEAFDTFDPYEAIPDWCEVKSIRFYDEKLITVEGPTFADRIQSALDKINENT